MYVCIWLFMYTVYNDTEMEALFISENSYWVKHNSNLFYFLYSETD